MADLILVSGFLGAGKTTLMKRLIDHYRAFRLHVIVNEFGRGTDGALLSVLGAAVTEIDNGSVFCACRAVDFERALRAAAQDAEMILVEASGLSDPVSIHTVTQAIPGIRYLGCVALADATGVAKVLRTARVSARQLSVAKVILLNKCDLVPCSESRETRRMLMERYPYASVHRTINAVFSPPWLSRLAPGESFPDQPHVRDIALQKARLDVKGTMTSDQLLAFIRQFAEDTNRVKGFVTLKDGAFLVDCVGAYVQLVPQEGSVHGDNALNVLAGPGLPMRRSLKDAVGLFSEYVTEVR
ncbi:MAG: GTP-binding protein [Clostridiales bacterium]|nr:GTP-binding protein [Clostridiales bacterium]